MAGSWLHARMIQKSISMILSFKTCMTGANGQILWLVGCKGGGVPYTHATRAILGLCPMLPSWPPPVAGASEPCRLAGWDIGPPNVAYV